MYGSIGLPERQPQHCYSTDAAAMSHWINRAVFQEPVSANVSALHSRMTSFTSSTKEPASASIVPNDPVGRHIEFQHKQEKIDVMCRD